MAAPSIRRWRLWFFVSVARSLPAKSTKDNLPCSLPDGSRMMTSQTACDREETEFISVACVARALSCSNSSSSSIV